MAKLSINRIGAGVTEYLLLTAAIAGVVIPIAYRFFAEPVRDSLFKQRRTLVDFIAQTPKRPVPGVWFSKEQEARPDPDDLEGSKTLDDPKSLEVGTLNASGELKTGDLRAPGNLTVGTISGSGLATSGGGGGRSGGGVDSGGGATGGSGFKGTLNQGEGGDSALSDNFFKGGDKRGSSSESGEAGSQQRFGASGSEGGRKAGSSGGGGGDSTKVDKGRGERGGGTSTQEVAKRGGGLLMDQVNELDKRRSEPFDWWFLIKFLVLCFILFLIILIALSNLKKR